MPQSPTTASRAHPGGHRWTVRAHLALVLVAAVVLAGAALGYGYVWSADRAEEDATARMRTQAQLAAGEIAQTLAVGLEQVAAVTGQDLTAVFAQPEGCSLNVAGSDAFPSVRLDIVGPAGQVACSSQAELADLGASPFADSEWLAPVLAAPESLVVWPADDAVTGSRAIVVAGSYRA